jgi:hypothetical protein
MSWRDLRYYPNMSGGTEENISQDSQ